MEQEKMLILVNGQKMCPLFEIDGVVIFNAQPNKTYFPFLDE